MISSLQTRCGFAWPGWKAALIWTLGLMVLTGLTVMDLCPLVRDYHYNNVATQIKTVSHNASSATPSATFCIPWTRRAISNIGFQLYMISRNESSEASACRCYEQMKNRSWDVWKDMDFSEISKTPIPTSPYFQDQHPAFDIARMVGDAIVKKLFQDPTDDFEVLDVSNIDWNQPIFDAIFRFFSCLTSFDADMGPEMTGPISCPWCLPKPDFDFALVHNAKIEKVFDRIVHLLCEHIIFHRRGDYEKAYWFTPLNKTACVQLIFTRRPVIVRDHFCFSFPIDDVWNVAVNASPWSGQYGHLKALHDSMPFSLISDTEYISWPPACLIHSHLIHASKHGFESVDIRYHTAAKVTETRSDVHCYNETCPGVCKSNCIINKIIDTCHCIPFTYKNHVLAPKTLPYCNSILYARCNFSQETELQKCNTRCMNPCEFVSYQWYSTVTSMTDTSRGLWMTFESIYTTYLEFSIITKNTPEQFFSQIGAVFNFYLGFSGVSVIAAAIFFANLFQRWTSKTGEISIAGSTVELAQRGNDSLMDGYWIRKEITLIHEKMQEGIEAMRDELKASMAKMRDELRKGNM